MSRKITNKDSEMIATGIAEYLDEHTEAAVPKRVIRDLLREVLFPVFNVEVIREFVNGDMVMSNPLRPLRPEDGTPVYYVRRGGSWVETIPRPSGGSRRYYSDEAMRKFLDAGALVEVDFS